jgi:hypothetical protein
MPYPQRSEKSQCLERPFRLQRCESRQMSQPWTRSLNAWATSSGKERCQAAADEDRRKLSDWLRIEPTKKRIGC